MYTAKTKSVSTVARIQQSISWLPATHSVDWITSNCIIVTSCIRLHVLTASCMKLNWLFLTTVLMNKTVILQCIYCRYNYKLYVKHTTSWKIILDNIRVLYWRYRQSIGIGNCIAYTLPIRLTQYFSGFADYIAVKPYKYNLKICATKAEYVCNCMYFGMNV